jgi:hypothetical protein
MVVTRTPPAAPQVRSDDAAAVRGFRPASRRRSRMMIGAALVAVAVGGNLLVYSNLDQRTEVLQVVRDVPAGSVLGAGDFRPVAVGADPSVRTVEAGELSAVIGRYTKVRLVAGSLLVAEALQAEPLVAPGSAIVAVQIPEGALPAGLRERSQVQLVLPPARSDDAGSLVVVAGRVVGLPTSPSSVTGRASLSVEVDQADAAVVAAGDDVRVVLLEPGADAADHEGPGS